MISAVCAQVESAFRDLPDPDFGRLPAPIFYSFCLHQINAFGYRPDWAQALLAHVQFDAQDRPYFPVAPATPEAHRHKFLCALVLSENSPRRWDIGGHAFQAEAFVGPILESPPKEWGDNSLVPEPSWTLQYLSAFFDESGRWQGQETPIVAVAQDFWNIYFRDFANGDLWQPGKTPFTESGLHFLEAINKLCLRQAKLALTYFPDLKRHLGARLQKSLEESSVLLSNPDWVTQNYRHRALEIALTQLLLLGHMLEICFHPRGALRGAWARSEIPALGDATQQLARLMGLFFDSQVLDLMNEEQKRSYPFPLLHAYHALVLGASLPLFQLSSPGPSTIP